MLFHKCKLRFFNPKHAHANLLCGQNIENNTWSKNKDGTQVYEHERMTVETPEERERRLQWMKAIQTGPNASKASPDDAAGLDPVIYIAHGARVMLTSNFCTEFGLVNGAMATVIAFATKPAKHHPTCQFLLWYSSIPTQAPHFMTEQFLSPPSATPGLHQMPLHSEYRLRQHQYLVMHFGTGLFERKWRRSVNFRMREQATNVGPQENSFFPTSITTLSRVRPCALWIVTAHASFSGSCKHEHCVTVVYPIH